MKNILVIGATGQIGSELTMKLRGIYGNDHVVCGYIPSAAPKGELLESGPAEIVDVTNSAQIAEVVKKHNVDAIYNLAALFERRCRRSSAVGLENRYRRFVERARSST